MVFTPCLLILVFYSLPSICINVHITPSSHIDQGWLKTVEEYQPKVFDILFSITTALSVDPSRTFSWAELYYFSRWYSSLTPSESFNVKSLVESNRLNIVHDGLVSSDEALTTIESTLLQVTRGRQFKHSAFDVASSKTYFQVDAFGHSTSHLEAACSLGYKYAVLNRINHKVEKFLFDSKNALFTWESSNFGAISNCSLLCLVLDDHYSSPKGFDFEEDDVDEFNHDPEVLDNRAHELIDYLMDKAAKTNSSELMLIIGDDFKFVNAEVQFKNWDILISYVNENFENFNLFYSSPDRYFQDVEASNSISDLLTVSGSFLPHADSVTTYWSGYYSTQPNLKKYLRILENRKHLFDTISLFFPKFSTSPNNSGIAKVVNDNISLLQHHDAITGTCRTDVVENYIEKLKFPIEQVDLAVRQFFVVSSTLDVFLNVFSTSITSETLVTFSVPLNSNFTSQSIESRNISIHPVFENEHMFDSVNSDLSISSSDLEFNFLHSIAPFSVESVPMFSNSQFLLPIVVPVITVYGNSNSLDFPPIFNDIRYYSLQDIPSSIFLKAGDISIELSSNGMLKYLNISYISYNISSAVFFLPFYGRLVHFNPLPVASTLLFQPKLIVITESDVCSTFKLQTFKNNELFYKICRDTSNVVISVKMKPLHNSEIFFRLSANFITDFDHCLIHDSIKFSKVFSNGAQPLREQVYPAVFSTAIIGNKSHLIVDNSHSSGVFFLDNSVNYLVTRNSQQDDYKGLGQPNLDTNYTSLELVLKPSLGDIDSCYSKQPKPVGILSNISKNVSAQHLLSEFDRRIVTISGNELITTRCQNPALNHSNENRVSMSVNSTKPQLHIFPFCSTCRYYLQTSTISNHELYISWLETIVMIW
ncbi:hypothetical protein GEMRC1_011430 [Eukaryota sp. GEM-RC1]